MEWVKKAQDRLNQMFQIPGCRLQETGQSPNSLTQAGYRKVIHGSAMGIAVFLGAFAISNQDAQAVVQITIDDPNLKATSIAVAPLFGGSGREQEIGRNISSVVAANLERSGLFSLVDEGSFIQDAASLKDQPRFPDWRAVNAELLLSGNVIPLSDGNLRVEFHLWDVFAEENMISTALKTHPDNWRRFGHIISDTIFTRVTGEGGYFDTRVVYIAESGPSKHRKKRLAIMDQDGENHRFLTDGNHMVLTPRFSPTAQEITYFQYFQRQKPRVYLFNIDTGQQELLGDNRTFPGMTFAPRFSPNGKAVVLSMALGGNSEIYVMDLGTRRVRRLTRHPAADTAPTYSPKMDRITFESDRGGSQQIYVMDSSGSNVHRISFGKGRYATPVWSPRGDQIAFTRMSGGVFSIGVMRPDGSQERTLDSSYMLESPTWAPNGRFLMYYGQNRQNSAGTGGTARLYTIDLTGRNKRQLPTPVSASDPAWSPLLP